MAETRQRRSIGTAQSVAGDRSRATELGVELTEEMIGYSDAIARRAYELYEERGREDGHDLDDWLHAEADLRTSSRGD